MKTFTWQNNLICHQCVNLYVRSKLTKEGEEKEQPRLADACVSQSEKLKYMVVFLQWLCPREKQTLPEGGFSALLAGRTASWKKIHSGEEEEMQA